MKDVVMRSANVRAVLIGVLLVAAPLPAFAFENFDKGKTPAQLFTSDCGICHNSPVGLGAQMAPQALSGFLTEHYTASAEIANVLAGYLISVGKDTREAKPSSRRHTRAAKPDDDATDKPAKPRRSAKPHGDGGPSEHAPRKPKSGDSASSDVTGSTAKP
jgi:hypothetical protein